MGIKRRAMFSPKFKNTRPKRWEMGQEILSKKTKDNSETIEILKEQGLEQDNTDTSDIVEEMIKEVEELISETTTVTYESSELKRIKKAELLQIADSLSCSVTNKNTKAQIIAAIEKQSS